MIRILQVLPRLRRGGSQAMVMSLYRVLDRDRFQFDFVIFSQDHDDYYDEILSLGGKIYHLSKFNGKNLSVIKREWDSFFQEHSEYTILHSHVRSFASIYIPIAKKHGLTTIIHSHSTSNEPGIAGVAKTILEYPLRYQADYLFACSTEAGKWLFGKKAISANNYRFIPNAIDVCCFSFNSDDRARIRSMYGIHDEVVVGHVGGFERPKNHSFLIECFVFFLELVPNAKLMLVGDGTYENEIRKRVAEKELSDKVIFAGLQANVGPFLSAMDVFLFPSLWEGLPVSVVEAQASGLKCLLSDCITHDVELTNQLTYFSLSKGPKEWACKLAEIAKDGRNPATETNLTKIKSFDSKQVVRNLEDFYTMCVNGGKTV